MPSVAWRAGRITSCVDFVVSACDHIRHAKVYLNKNASTCRPQRHLVGDVARTSSAGRAAPKMNLFINASLLGFSPKSVKKG